MTEHEQQPTRWENCGGTRGYGEKFADMVRAGADVYGEARLADTLAGRNATILDAGCGMGRIGATLQQRGHDAVGVDLDAELLAQAKTTFPAFPTLQLRLDDVTAETLAAGGLPEEFDLVVCVGNVMILLAPDSERLVLERLGGVLKSDGRLLVGFHTDATPPESRVYSPEEFVADAAAVGLTVQHHFGTYDLLPTNPEGNYVIFVLVKS